MKIEVRGQRSEVREQGSGFRVRGLGESIANWKLQNANCKLRTDSSFILHPSSFINHSSSFRHRPARRGLSLMEVLIAIFVLSIGLLGVAALIPLGQIALLETAKSDRSGACGRAAMREIQVRRMLDFRYWYWAKNFWGFYPPYNLLNTIPYNFINVSTCTDSMPFVVDPLGISRGLPYSFGQNPNNSNIFLPRRTLSSKPLTQIYIPQNTDLISTTGLADQIFFWNDDLPFDAPKNSIARPTLVSTTSEGNYSWFFTAMPAATEMSLPVAGRRLFNVSVAVCYKRNFQVYDPSKPPSAVVTHALDGEHTASIRLIDGFPGMGIGGGTVKLDAGNQVKVKENQWVMLYYLHLNPATGNPLLPAYPVMNRCNWYRVVGVGGNTNTLSLSGPDWDLYGPAWVPDNPSSDPPYRATLVVVPGVIGVYTTTMELDWDPLWTK